MREFALVERLSERLQARRGDTRVAIGDDAAVIAPPAGRELAVTTDTLIAGRHFPDDTPAFDIGYKALAVNFSDLAAMGAQPAWVTIALAAPALEALWCDTFVDGALAAIGDAPVDIVGGDTTRGALSITVTAIGVLAPQGAVKRSGARPGDAIAVTGTLGDAALGLSLWPQRKTRTDADIRFLLSRLCRPSWRDGAALCGRAHAAIDVSDGLAADLGHILAASGCGASVNVDALPASGPLLRGRRCRNERLRLQLSGGDDYELCIVLRREAVDETAAALGCPLTRIGEIEQEPGLRLVDGDGRSVTLPNGSAAGWDHFD